MINHVLGVCQAMICQDFEAKLLALKEAPNGSVPKEVIWGWSQVGCRFSVWQRSLHLVPVIGAEFAVCVLSCFCCFLSRVAVVVMVVV